MTRLSNRRELGRLRDGAAIIFEFAGVQFYGIVDDASALAEHDSIKVIFYYASDPKFSSDLPAFLSLRGVSSYLRASRLRFPNAAQWLAIKVAAA